MNFYLFLVVVSLSLGSSALWDLQHLGIDDNYYVSSIIVYRTRAFLSLSRSVCHNNYNNPTIVEVAWTFSDYFFPLTNILSGRNKILEYQEWGNCKDIQDAVSVDVEPKKHRLWILDKGNAFCSPKIIAYNFLYNSISESSELTNIPRENLNVLRIDHKHGEYGPRAYIGNAGDNILLVFSLREIKWWRLQLADTNHPYVIIRADFLALSKTDSELFITGKNELELFTLNLEDIRNSEEPLASEAKDMIVMTNVSLLGEKLGKSTAIETDYKSGLNYYMTRDYAIVRWIIGSPLTAEHHNVLAQSYEKLPYVSNLFTGPQNGLWALVNPRGPEECVDADRNALKLDSRVVKILKYNKFDKELEID